jgi:thioredoxin reductase (NADPH)
MSFGSRSQPPLLHTSDALGDKDAWTGRGFLRSRDAPFEFAALASGPHGRPNVGVQRTRDSPLPAGVFADGSGLGGPAFRPLAKRCGWCANPSRPEYDLAIHGGAPAGPSPAVGEGAIAVAFVHRRAK